MRMHVRYGVVRIYTNMEGVTAILVYSLKKLANKG